MQSAALFGLYALNVIAVVDLRRARRALAPRRRRAAPRT